MIKKIIIVLIMSCTCTNSHAQLNLVRNGSLEQYNNCPYQGFQINYANYWGSIDTAWVWISVSSLTSCPMCIPNYINGCSDTIPGSECSEPNNVRFYHYPHTGNGMADIMVYNDTPMYGIAPNFYPEQRSYLQTQLTTTLTAGQSYCVSFFVLEEAASAYAVNHIGAYLDNGTIDTAIHYCGIPHMEFTPPQILDTVIISDTTNWTKIQGSFIATGTESFITIGNLYDTAHTEHINLNSDSYTFYLVDDISVIASDAVAYAGRDTTISQGDSTWIGIDSNGDGMPCMWYVLGNPTVIDSGGYIMVKPDTTTTYVVSMDLCGNVTTDTVTVKVTPLGISNLPYANLNKVTVYPNPTKDVVNVSGINAPATYQLSDMIGSEMLQGVLDKSSNSIDVSKLPPGVYVLEMSNETRERKVFKVMKE